MADKTGFIKLDRNILKWRWYQDINTKCLFLHILLNANYVDADFETITVHRGEMVTSYTKLALETGLSVRSVRTAIEHLKATGEVTVKSYAKFSVITVVNYSLYQDVDSLADRQPTGDRQASDRQPTGDRQQYKNNKNNKKERNKEIYIAFCNEHPEFNAPVLMEALNAFDEMRTKMKKPMTDHGRELMLKKLMEIGGDPVAVLNQSIANSWLGLFPIKQTQPQKQTSAPQQTSGSDDHVDPMIKRLLERRRNGENV